MQMKNILGDGLYILVLLYEVDIKQSFSSSIYKFNILLKISSHKMKKIKSVFLLLGLCSQVNLSKHNIYTLFGRLKQFFSCFCGSIISITHASMHSVNK